MVLREIHRMHGGRSACPCQGVAQPSRMISPEGGSPPADPLEGRRGAADHPRDRLPSLAAHAHAVAAHAVEPGVVLERYQKWDQVSVTI